MRWLHLLGLSGYLAGFALPLAAQSAKCAASPTEAIVDSNALLLESDAGLAHSDGNYHIILRTRGDKDLRAVHLWVKRAATPNFAGASWREVPLKDAKLNPGNPGAYNLVKTGAVAIASQAQKYLAIKGEIEVVRDGTVRRLASQTLRLPNVRVWTLKTGSNSSREVYVQPSEPTPSLRLWVAHSATRDFAKADWQTVPVTQIKNSSWLNYHGQASITTLQKPWIAVYSDATFGASPVRARSPQLIWNGRPFSKNPAEITGKTCPLHGTTAGVVPIAYGIPTYSDSKVALQGGCVVGPGSPIWHCNWCDCSWGDFMAQKNKS